MAITQQVDNLLNGVSQAPPHLRDPSQGDEQINMLSHRARGLRKRPPTEHVAQVATDPTGFDTAYDAELNVSSSKQFRAVVVNGDLKVYSALTGAECPVVFPAGKAYLASALRGFRHVVVGARMFLINRNVTVAKKAIESPAAVPQALVVVKFADYGASYRVTVNGTEVSYRVPQSADPNSEQAKETVAVAAQLVTALGGKFAADFTITQLGSSVHLVRKDGAEFTFSVTDGVGGKGLLGIKDTVQSFIDLPTPAKEGMVVEVVGAPESTADNYFVEFTEGVWRETIKPGILTSLDATTMPHVLEFSGNVVNDRPAQAPAPRPVITAADATQRWLNGFTSVNGVASDQTQPQLAQSQGDYMDVTPAGTDGTQRTVRAMFDVDTQYLDSTESITVALQVNTGSGFSTVRTAGYNAGYVWQNETITYSAALPATTAVRLLLTYSSGSTPRFKAKLTGHSSLDGDGAGVMLESGVATLVTFDPDQMYPVGYAITATVESTNFSYTPTGTDATGKTVAQQLQALIDADPTYAATITTDGQIRVSGPAGRPATTVAVTAFLTSNTFWNSLLGLTPGAQVGNVIKNLTDGSSGTITANSQTTITAALTGGADNRFNEGDVCVVVGSGDYFVFAPAAWKARAVGDDTSAPFPSFAERTLDEVAFYENRLVVTARESVVCSEAGDSLNFFRTTTTDVLEADPIDVRSSSRYVSAFGGAVAWSDGLYLTTDGSDLFRLGGRPALTPRTVRLDYVGEYTASAQVRPVLAGGKLFLASVKNGYTHVAVGQQIQNADGDIVLDVSDLTTLVPAYLVGSPIAFAADSEASMLFVLTDTKDGNGTRRLLYVCSYSFGGRGLEQLSWSKWQLAPGSTLVGLNILNGVLSLLVSRTGGVFLETISLDPAAYWPGLLADGAGTGDGSYNGSGNLA